MRTLLWFVVTVSSMDSPYPSQVRAARSGHVLVIDEADKASVHVIAILKSLLDTGEKRERGEGSVE